MAAGAGWRVVAPTMAMAIAGSLVSVVINLATEFKTSVWLWVAVAVATGLVALVSFWVNRRTVANLGPAESPGGRQVVDCPRIDGDNIQIGHGGRDVNLGQNPPPQNSITSVQARPTSRFAQYRTGIDLLREEIGDAQLREHHRRLLDNLAEAEQSGDTMDLRRERSNLIYQLNSVAYQALGRSFTEICGFGVTYATWAQSVPRLASALPLGQFRTITEDRTTDFVGRDWLLDDIYGKTQSNDMRSGYIIVTGPPGIGKTSIVAALWSRHRWVHHYVIDELNTARQLLESLCAQLILTYRLTTSDPFYQEDKPNETLLRLLDAAGQASHNRPVVLLVDGLDAADPARPTMFLPRELPEGTFVVITTQPLPSPLGFENFIEVPFDQDDASNHDDIRLFVNNYIEDNVEMAGRIRALGMDRAEFTDELLSRSGGNFMYMKYLLRDVHRDQIRKQDFERGKIPANLTDYYSTHWRRMRRQSPENFERCDEPIAAFLALRGELPFADLVAYSELPPRAVQDSLERLTRFTLSRDNAADTMYRLYHPSFRQFLRHNIVGLNTYAARIEEVIESRFAGTSDGETADPTFREHPEGP